VKLEFFEPPAVPGFGTAGGISMLVLDKTFSADYQRLGEVTEKFMAALKKRKEVTNMFTFYAANYPQYELIINNDLAMQKGVSIKAAMDNLNILIGSTWEQGFIRFNQFYKVFVQALPEFRRYPEDLENLFVKNDQGGMVPYSAFMTVKKKQGLNEITRYNLYTSAAIQCAPAAGYSTGQAIQAIKEVGADIDVLPRGFDIGWAGLSYDESRKGNEAVYIFLIVVAFVYLVLVGQYESFILPLAVILSLPVGLFGSFLFLQAMGLANDVYAQIGLVMLVGLLGKNAILIVEFAVQRRREGVSLKEAAVEGARLRFRPIQMTSFAFIAGLLPLVVATGAGAIGNRTIGTTGAGGMLVGTVIGVLVIPGLYYLFGQLDGGRKLLKDEADEPLSEVLEHQAHEAHDGESTHERDSNGLPHPCQTAESPASLLSKHVVRRPFPLKILESTEEESTVGIGPDLQLMSWSDGLGVPTSGHYRVIAGTDIDGLLHIRTFDLRGIRTDTFETRDNGGELHLDSADASGKVLSDAPESSLPTIQAGAITTLKQQLPGLLPPHVLGRAERDQVLSKVTSIIGYTRGNP
jgi:AcrB/AcrD/AcrF family